MSPKSPVSNVAVPGHTRGRVLVVDDDHMIVQLLRVLFETRGFECDVVTEPHDVHQAVERFAPEAVVLDYSMPEISGLTLLAELRQRDSSITTLLLSGDIDVPTTVQALRAGAEDVQTKPVNSEMLIAAVERGIARTRVLRSHRMLSTQVADPFGLLDDSPAMRRVIRVVESLARSSTPVMIVGEVGTGKRTIAQMLHQFSPRVGRPFTSVFCGGAESDRLERDLLGDAASPNGGEGILALTRGGTLLLEQPAVLSNRVQSALIEVSNPSASLNGESPIRLVTSTRRDLSDDVRRGVLRSDVYHRLAAIPLMVPPLRSRGPDAIRTLAERFVQSCRVEAGEGPTRLTTDALQELVVAPWPGNVRQLRNVIESAFASALDEESITEIHLRGALEIGVSSDALHEDLSLQAIERQHIMRVLAMTGGQRSEAARILGITRTTLYKRIEEYGDGSPPAS